MKGELMCKGSMQFGNGCGRCSRCKTEIERAEKLRPVNETWELATSNSWRRIVTATTHMPVITPCIQSDGHPDLMGNQEDLQKAAAAEDMYQVLNAIGQAGDVTLPDYLRRDLERAIAKAQERVI